MMPIHHTLPRAPQKPLENKRLRDDLKQHRCMRRTAEASRETFIETVGRWDSTGALQGLGPTLESRFP